jgi:hypothetical protein
MGYDPEKNIYLLTGNELFRIDSLFSLLSNTIWEIIEKGETKLSKLLPVGENENEFYEKINNIMYEIHGTNTNVGPFDYYPDIPEKLPDDITDDIPF